MQKAIINGNNPHKNNLPAGRFAGKEIKKSFKKVSKWVFFPPLSTNNAQKHSQTLKKRLLILLHINLYNFAATLETNLYLRQLTSQATHYI